MTLQSKAKNHKHCFYNIIANWESELHFLKELINAINLEMTFYAHSLSEEI